MTRRDPSQPPGPQKPQAADPLRAAVYEYGNHVADLAGAYCQQQLTAREFTTQTQAARRHMCKALAALGVAIPPSQLRFLDHAILEAAEDWAQGNYNSSTARHRWKKVVRWLLRRAVRRQHASVATLPCRHDGDINAVGHGELESPSD